MKLKGVRMHIIYKLFHGVVSLALCLMMAVPNQINSQEIIFDDNCYNVCPCVPAKPSCSRGNFRDIALGALLGAAAGAGTGYAVGHNNRGHESKNKTAAVCAVDDLKGCLTFDVINGFFIEFMAPLSLFSSSVQYFVTTPNGCTVFGDTIVLSDQSSIFTNFSFSANGTIKTPICCGTYQIGLNISITSNELIREVGIGDVFASITKDNTIQNVMLLSGYDVFFGSGEGQAPPLKTFSGQFVFPYEFISDCCVSKSSCK